MITNQLLYQLSYTGFWADQTIRRKQRYYQIGRFVGKRSHDPGCKNLLTNLSVGRTMVIALAGVKPRLYLTCPPGPQFEIQGDHRELSKIN